MKRLRPKTRSYSSAFTLVEIMIVVSIIALLASLAVPGFLRARKRAQATSIRADLRLIDSAMDQYALEYNKPGSSMIPVAAWKAYIKPGSRLYSTGADLFGNVYGDQQLGTLPPVPATSYDNLSDVVDATFWSPYVKGP